VDLLFLGLHFTYSFSQRYVSQIDTRTIFHREVAKDAKEYLMRFIEQT